MSIILIDPTSGRKNEFLKMIEEFRFADEEHFVYEDVLKNQGFEAYLEWLQLGREGQIDELCPWSAFWAIEQQNNCLVGLCSVRHTLSPWMAEYGGHIGYRVRPSSRRKGYGTQILRLALSKVKDLKLDRILVVCEPHNLGSIGVIKKNGGVFERQVSTSIKEMLLNRYWIPKNYC